MKRHVWFWRAIGIATALMIAAIWFVPTKARADGISIQRSRGQITIRRTYYDDGWRRGREESGVPNACDDLGTVGIEAISGPDAGTCYPSVVGRR